MLDTDVKHDESPDDANSFSGGAWLRRSAVDAPNIIILSDGSNGGADTRSAVEAAGGGVAASLRFEEVLADDLTLDAADLIFVDYEGRGGSAIDPILDMLTSVLARRRAQLLITTSLQEIDLFSGLLADPNVGFLCQPSRVERALAIKLALMTDQDTVHDRTTELETERLRRLAEEIGRIARSLSTLSAGMPSSPDYQSAVGDVYSQFKAEPMFAAETAATPDAAEIRSIIRQRRLRDRYFAPDLFADPAWDMLLDLMAARAERVQVAVSSLCIAAAVPPTTALRWIKTMTDVGLFERASDPEDGRRIFIQLSDKAANAMANYLSLAKQSGFGIV